MTTQLQYWRHDDPYEYSTAQSQLWGHLFDLSEKNIRCYRNDRYHDATWIREHCRHAVKFLYSTRESGTSIGFDIDYVGFNFDHLYRVKIMSPTNDENVRGSWQWSTEISELGT